MCVYWAVILMNTYLLMSSTRIQYSHGKNRLCEAAANCFQDRRKHFALVRVGIVDLGGFEISARFLGGRNIVPSMRFILGFSLVIGLCWSSPSLP